jgi:HlyD family secretion protein
MTQTSPDALVPSRWGRIVRRVLLRLLVLGGAGAGAWYAWQRHQADKPPPFRYETTTVDRGKISAKVTATGTLSALVTVQVGSQVSGRIAELKVDFNSAVHKGDVLARIDPQLFQAAVAQAQANNAAARGDLAKAKAQAVDADLQWKRAKLLADKKFIAAADLDTAQATAAAGRAQVVSAKGHLAQADAALNQAKVNLTFTTIVSPIDGTVISRSVDVGQTVAASLQTPTLFLIAEDLKRMQVDTSVAEADIGKLAPDMAASFTVDAWPGETFQGTVRQIRNAPQTVQNVVTYDAVIDVKNPKLQLKPGMTANVTFVHAQRDDVLRVSNSALRFQPSPELLATLPDAPTTTVGAWKGRREGAGGAGGGGGRRKTVWLLEKGKPVMVPVFTGITDGSLTEIVHGKLKAGDRVVTDAVETEPAKPAAGAAPGGRAGGRMF